MNIRPVDRRVLSVVASFEGRKLSEQTVVLLTAALGSETLASINQLKGLNLLYENSEGSLRCTLFGFALAQAMTKGPARQRKATDLGGHEVGFAATNACHGSQRSSRFSRLAQDTSSLPHVGT